jgi:hypothetical protein
MGKQNVVCTYNGVLLIPTEETCMRYNGMNLEGIILSETDQSHKDKECYFIYVKYLE